MEAVEMGLIAAARQAVAMTMRAGAALLRKRPDMYLKIYTDTRKIAYDAITAGLTTPERFVKFADETKAAHGSGFGTVEEYPVWLEAVADFFEREGTAGSDTVPQTTAARPTRAEAAAKLREFAARCEAGEHTPELAMEAGQYASSTGYLDGRTTIELSMVAAKAHPGKDNVAQLPYTLRLCADEIERSADKLSPEQQLIAGRVFAGAQPHRFAKEVM